MYGSNVVLVFVGFLLVLNGCGKRSTPVEAAAPNASVLVVSGELSYRERIALRPGSAAVVELRDVSIADASAVVIEEQRIDLMGRQVPFPFRLTVDRTKLNDRRRYSVRGRILGPAEQLLWTTTEAHLIDPAAGSEQLGTLMMSQTRPGPAPSPVAESSVVYQCGDQEATLRVEDGQARLSVLDETFLLTRTPAASGAKYEVPGDPSTFFWTKGERAMLEIRGHRYTECETAGGGVGQELQDGEWVVEDINGRGIIDNSRGTLNFSADGAVSGMAFCNNYRGSYTLNGDNLTMGQLVSTRRACPPALMNQEKLFTDVLAAVHRFEINANGALILHASGQTITARQE
jgi:heat shock protein HslJ/uncharacterized lipoprotein YbaY